MASSEQRTASADPPFTVEYAKSGRATCLHVDSGVKTGAKIEKDELRVCKQFQLENVAFATTNWYHVGCFFSDLTYQKPTTARVSSIEELSGYDGVSGAHQKLLQRLIDKSEQLAAKWGPTVGQRKENAKPEVVEEREREREMWKKMTQNINGGEGDKEEEKEPEAAQGDKSNKKAQKLPKGKKEKEVAEGGAEREEHGSKKGREGRQHETKEDEKKEPTVEAAAKKRKKAAAAPAGGAARQQAKVAKRSKKAETKEEEEMEAEE